MEQAIGYIFDQPGKKYLYKYYFELNAKKITTFLIENIKHEVTITDGLDKFLCKGNENCIFNTVYSEELEKEIIYEIAMTSFHGLEPLMFEEREGCMVEI